MQTRSKSAADWLSKVSAFILAVGAIFATLTQSIKSVRELVSDLHLPPALWWGIAAALSGVALLLRFRASSAQRSRLIDPSALLLKTERQEHLEGREDDLDRLLPCVAQPQVNLVGESGAGKTALIRSGLCVRLKGSSFLPVYVDSWGRDWAAGPRRATTESLHRALSTEERAQLGDTSDLSGTLTAIRLKLHRTPLLIFDQFDDYQTQHIERFLPPAQRTWITADDLAARNPFWSEIRSLLQADAIHCVFVTRADAAAGLESVRFVRPAMYSLDRLRPIFVVPLLARLTSPSSDGNEVVTDPDNGWFPLRERLARDLSASGSVLPAQMKLALKGLSNLPALTVGEYERHGGLAGLEAADIEWHIDNATSSAAVAGREPLAVLVAMVDRQSMKAVPRTTADLVTAAEAEGRAADILHPIIEHLLDVWETRELVRARIDPDSGEKVWALDHDYLCRGVLAVERRTDRWGIALREAHDAFRATGGDLLRKWRALLSTPLQLRLAYERLRGRLTYGTASRYAVLSVTRFVPLMVVLCLCVLGAFVWLRIRANSQARDYLERIGVETGYYSHDDEYRALQEVAASSRDVRIFVLRDAITSPASRQRVAERLETVVQAIVQLDPRMRQRVADEVVYPGLAVEAQIPMALTIAQLLELDDPRIVEAVAKNKPGSFKPRSGWKAFAARADDAQRLTLALALLGQDVSAAKEICSTLPARRCADAAAALIIRDPSRVRELAGGLQTIGEASPQLAAKARAALLTALRTNAESAVETCKALVAYGVRDAAEEQLLLSAVQTRANDDYTNFDVVRRLHIPIPNDLSVRMALRHGIEEDEFDQIYGELDAVSRDRVLDALILRAFEPKRMVDMTLIRRIVRAKASAIQLRAIERRIRELPDHRALRYEDLDELSRLLPSLRTLKPEAEAKACTTLITTRFSGYKGGPAQALEQFAGLDLSGCAVAWTFVIRAIEPWLDGTDSNLWWSHGPETLSAAFRVHVVAPPEQKQVFLRRWRTAKDSDVIHSGLALVTLFPDLDEATRREIALKALATAEEGFSFEAEQVQDIFERSRIVPEREHIVRAAQALAESASIADYGESRYLKEENQTAYSVSELGQPSKLLYLLLTWLPDADRRPVLDTLVGRLPHLSGAEATTVLILAREFNHPIAPKALVNIARSPTCTGLCPGAVLRSFHRITGKQVTGVWEIANVD